MAQKKCPKCGEDNPAEAVMCWACYTPLSGGAATAGPPTRGGVPGPPGSQAPGGEPTEKKKMELDPKMIGIVAFLVVGGGLAVVMNTGILSGGGGEDDGGTPSAPAAPADPPPADPNAGQAPPGPGAAPAFIASANLPAPQPLPYTTVVPPNGRFATGTVGILPTNTAITPIQAGSLARFARTQYLRRGKWKAMQIVVFTDANTARLFADFQARKRGAPLTQADYRQLADANIWRNTSAYLQSAGKSERIDYPSKSPYSWWQNNR